ncbi:MAG: HEPN domain-containing protein [Deltaproteobacteria bacterium]|nr:HEPN domain-containing protein [Deltaproteobacteria bacterium]
MTLAEEDLKALTKVRLENADKALDDAEALFERDSLRGAANRVYYAMFYAVSALAISQGRSFRRHSGLIAYFQKEFVLTGLLNRKHGRALQKAFEDRSEADYQDYAKLTKEQIQARMDEASDLITAVKDLVYGT